MHRCFGTFVVTTYAFTPNSGSISKARFNHPGAGPSAVFDVSNLVATVGLVPVMRLAELAGLSTLAQKQVSVPSDKGANPGAKVASLVAGVVAGDESSDDMRLLKHGGMGELFNRVYAPSTPGPFLREFALGHVRQLAAYASRFLAALTKVSHGLFPSLKNDFTFVDVDDTIIELEGHSGVRVLNAAIVIASTTKSAPVVLTLRLRMRSTSSIRGAKRVVSDALAQLKRMQPEGHSRNVLLRADSAYYSHAVITAAQHARTDVSVTVRMNPSIRRAIETITDDAWEAIEFPGAARDEQTGRLISRVEVAETR